MTDLVAEGDDRYVIQNAGDEITLRFDAGAFPALPDGWSRTFLIYSDGWVKDGDLNTATGDRVVPLPHRALSGYPPPSPSDGPTADEQGLLRETLTRPVFPERRRFPTAPMADGVSPTRQSPDLLSHPVIRAAIIGGLFAIVAAIISRTRPGPWRAWKIKRLGHRLQDICIHMAIDRGSEGVMIRPLYIGVGASLVVSCSLCRKRFSAAEAQSLHDQRWAAVLEGVSGPIERAFEEAMSLKRRLDALEDDRGRQNEQG